MEISRFVFFPLYHFLTVRRTCSTGNNKEAWITFHHRKTSIKDDKYKYILDIIDNPSRRGQRRRGKNRFFFEAGEKISATHLAELTSDLAVCFQIKIVFVIRAAVSFSLCCFQKIYLLVFLNFSVNLRIETVKNDPSRNKKFSNLDLIINFLSWLKITNLRKFHKTFMEKRLSV